MTAQSIMWKRSGHAHENLRGSAHTRLHGADGIIVNHAMELGVALEDDGGACDIEGAVLFERMEERSHRAVVNHIRESAAQELLAAVLVHPPLVVAPFLHACGVGDEAADDERHCPALRQPLHILFGCLRGRDLQHGDLRSLGEVLRKILMVGVEQWRFEEFPRSVKIRQECHVDPKRGKEDHGEAENNREHDEEDLHGVKLFDLSADCLLACRLCALFLIVNSTEQLPRNTTICHNSIWKFQSVGMAISNYNETTSIN
eukprot:scaffold6401_cov164-Ochromonas_danica.AAC.10